MVAFRMLRAILLILLILHGLIHLMGFSKAFQLAPMSQLTQPIGKPTGILWLAATVMLLLTAVVLALDKNWWWQLSIAAIALSQIAIVTSWRDARFGTIINMILLFMIVQQIVHF